MRIFALVAAALAATPLVSALELAKEFDHRDYKDYERPDRKPQPFDEGVLRSGVYPYNPTDKLTVEFLCGKLTDFADEAEFIQMLVGKLDCNSNNGFECYEPLRKALYELEFGLDLFDTAIDVSKMAISSRLTCEEEAKVACCYRNYADRMIAALNVLAARIPHLNGPSAYSVIIAVNSLRAADYTFVYELVRRMTCEEYQLQIFSRQGSIDGSTPDSIREAFARFVSTPTITGEDFKVLPGQKPPRRPDWEEIEVVKNIQCHNEPECEKKAEKACKKCEKCKKKKKDWKKMYDEKKDNMDNWEYVKNPKYEAPAKKLPQWAKPHENQGNAIP